MKNWHAALMIVAVIGGTFLTDACGEDAGTSMMRSAPTLQVTPETGKTAIPKVGNTPTASISSNMPQSPASTAEKSAPSTPARPVPVRVPGAAQGEMVITITGQVWDVAASARVIELVEPVHGIAGVALDDKTEITSADGKRLGLQDIKPGVVIQASGQADGNGGVLADKIRILTGPTPLPAARPTPY